MTRRHRITLREALNDPALLGHAIPGDSWKPWRTLLIAAMGEPLLPDERELFKQLTQRSREPGERVETLCVVKGRRAGGSSAIGKALIPYLSGLCQHPTLAPGERGILLCVSADQRQADVILAYAEAAFRGSPMLAQLIEARTARELRLTNNVTVEVRAADWRTLRGLTFIGACADELAFWQNENSANPDDEILNNAIKPGLATTGGPLILISSPHARRGELWRTYQSNFGAAGDPLVLVAQGGTRDFNATLPQRVIDRALERDHAAASAEWLGQFRTDIESFVTIEAVSQNIDGGTVERPPLSGVSYSGFIDPSGGSSDAMTLAIAHNDFNSQTIVLECLREAVPPFSPESTVEDFAKTLKQYGISRCVSDRYGGVWVINEFARFGISVEQSAAPKSDLYRDLLPLLNSRRVALLDNQKLVAQLVGLERRTARSGKDSIDHAPGAHDDLANCVAGVVAQVNKYGGYDVSYSGFGDIADDPLPDEWREQRRRRYYDELMQRYGQPCPVPLPGAQQ